MLYRTAGQFKTSYTADQALFPVRQDAVLLKRGMADEAAYDFIAFLRSDEAAAIIEAHGYKPG